VGTHDECDCDLKISFPSLGLPSIVQERYRGRRRTVAEMYAEAKAIVVSNYYLVADDKKEDVKVCKKPIDNEMYLNYMREYYTPLSQVAVEAPFPVSNSVASLKDPLCAKWKKVHEEAERHYWSVVYPDVNLIDKKEVRVMPDGQLSAIPSLRAMCAQKLSWSHTVYDKWYGEKRVVHSKENMGIEKALRLYSDFCVETTRRGPEELLVFKYVPQALGHLLSHMGVYENFGSLKLDYDPKKLIKKIRLFTSGGIMPGGTKIGTWNNTKVKIVAQGQKCLLVEAAMRKLHSVLYKIRNDEVVMCEAINCIIKAKDEYRYGQYKTVEELRAMTMKIREFFIPDLPHIYMCIMVNDKRMLLERNNVIRIGMTYWWGGAYFLFKYLNGDLKDFYWVDGDIEGLDKHISDWLLLLYCANVYPYYDWETTVEKDKNFLRLLLEYWATNVCAKMVCHIGGFWRFMVGQMYSGGKETSHGDSWIMAFIFYCYCEHIKAMHPHLSHLIDVLLTERYIVIVVYGDDHIWCAPRLLRSVMNQVTWKAFLKIYFGMTLREEHMYDSLLSVPDDAGRFVKVGPKFLKRYFIENTDSRYAPILPYKEIDESMCKLFTTQCDTVGENIPEVIGFAWDTMGTNKYAYDVVMRVYVAFMALNPQTPLQILNSIKENMDKTKLRRLMRKVNVPLSEYYKFPSMRRLMNRHVLDAEKANYHVRLFDLEKVAVDYEFDNDYWIGLQQEEIEEEDD